MNRRCLSWLLGLLLLVFWGLGCTETIHHGLTEGEANEIIVVLQEHGIDASKRRDPSGDDRWVIDVPSGVRVQAWRVLEVQGLPRAAGGGFGDFYPSGGLIPTSGEERILLQYATAREIQSAILKIEGVVDAHVNLVVPARPRVQLSTERVEPPRASVLVKYRPIHGESPIDEVALKRLVTGGVEGLEAENVEVIMHPSLRSLAPLESPKIGQVGPIAVTKESKLMLQLLIAAMGAVIMALAAALAVLLARARQGERA